MRNRIPRRRDGDRLLRVLDAHERLVMTCLLRRTQGATIVEICAAMGLPTGQAASALKRLSDPGRCGPLGAVALGRVYADDGTPTDRWGITADWCRTHRTLIAPEAAPARRPLASAA